MSGQVEVRTSAVPGAHLEVGYEAAEGSVVAALEDPAQGRKNTSRLKKYVRST